MRFSQEQMDDTILPKMELSDMSMKNKMGKSAKITDVAKSATTRKPKNLYYINDDLVMMLDKAVLKRGEVWRMDFWDYADYNNDYNIDLDRETLKGLAEFILKYLEQN